MWYSIFAETNGSGAFCFSPPIRNHILVGKAPSVRGFTSRHSSQQQWLTLQGALCAMPIMACEYCGKTFHLKPSAVKRGRGKFCSIRCKNLSQTLPQNNCIDCGVNIGRRSIRCRSCAQAERWINGNLGCDEVRAKRSAALRNPTPEYRALRSRISKKLWQDPGFRKKQIEYKTSPAWKSKISRLSKKWWKDNNYRGRQLKHLRNPKFRRYMQCLHSGANSHLWRGGISENPYDERFTRSLKAQIRERDDHRCKLCGCLEHGQAHDVHHIDYDKTNSVPDNLITLCVPCHRRTNHRRTQWIVRFGEMTL